MRNGYKIWDTDTHCRPASETLEPYFPDEWQPRLGELELPALPVVRPEGRADELFRQLQASGLPMAGVMEHGELTGLVPLSGLTTWIQLHQGPGAG